MKSYREDCIQAKEVKAGIREMRPVGSKSKAPRPVIIEYTYCEDSRFAQLWNAAGKWRKWKAYRNATEAQEALSTLNRKYEGFREFRLQEMREKHQ